MESWAIDLISSASASAQLFLDKTFRFTANLLREQLNLEGRREVAILETLYPSMSQNVTDGKFMFFDNKLSKLSEIYHLQHDLYPSIAEFDEGMNTLIQKRLNHNGSCITAEVFRGTQK